MSAAFLIARRRGLDELASQIGILLLLNLAFTFRPGISVGAHIGGLLAGGAGGVRDHPARAPPGRQLRPRSSSRPSSRSGSALVVASLIVAESNVPPGFA